MNSGSNGNAVYIESVASGSAVLLDCGISRKQIEMRLKVHGRYLSRNIPVFVTHEHADHVRGLAALSTSYHLPIYVTEQTFRNIWKRNLLKGFHFIGNTETVSVGDLAVTAFPKKHDAADPVGFVVECDGKRFVYATDLGMPDESIREVLPTADGALIESNYDVEMLVNGSYPDWLKERVLSDLGHLSNEQASAMVEECCDGRLQTLIYGHLSENNNTPDTVMQEWEALKKRKPGFAPNVSVASRYTVGEIIQV